jgi:hypothetical protein
MEGLRKVYYNFNKFDNNSIGISYHSNPTSWFALQFLDFERDSIILKFLTNLDKIEH